jgi:3',5'-cyclic-AMP phosphodiesterase
MAARFILAQISDLHVTNTPAGQTASLNLKRALAMLAPYQPNAIVATGDLVNDARKEEYAALAPLLAEPPAPLFLLPGNHDDREHLRAAFAHHDYLPEQGPLSAVIDDFPVRLVLLDQIVPGMTGGVFGADNAAWLEAALGEAPDKPTVIALHHHPFATHDRLFDTIGLEGRERFAEIVARHRQVQLVVAGHHHRCARGAVAHAPAIIAPSTAFSYSLALRADQPIAAKGSQAGFALHAWPQDGPPTSYFISL